MEYHFFNEISYSRIKSRVNQITPESKPLWGKMDAAQMLFHLARPLMQVLGEMELKQTFISRLFGRMVKGVNVGPKPFKRNLPTDPLFIAKGQKDFETEKAHLLQLRDRAYRVKKEDLDGRRHSFFGKLSYGEWDSLQGKHFDHHLSQFGV